MPRLESPALRVAESADAQERIRESEDQLMRSMERFGSYVVTRRRVAMGQGAAAVQNPTKVELSEPQRERMRLRFRTLADAAS